MKAFACALVMAVVSAALPLPRAQEPPPLRLAIAGLVHGHVSGFLRGAQGRKDVEIVGIFDADAALLRKYGETYKLPESALFTDLTTMIDRAKPDAIASFTNTFDHPAIVEAAAARRVHVMMEKPLAVSNAHAQRIRRAAEKAATSRSSSTTRRRGTRVMGAMWTFIKERRAAGDIRKMVALDGHSGPKAINVQPEFLDWLSDPVRNGGGALFDFGCYGANLMTWMMDNQRPLAVTAVTQQFQPEVYPRVDDEATILLEYPKAQGIIQASWNWPFNRKDFEVYGDHGLAIATGGSGLRVALPKEPEQAVTPEPRPPDERDSISHLIAVVRGTRKPNALSSLENNLIATEILEAARESARTRTRVTLVTAAR